MTFSLKSIGILFYDPDLDKLVPVVLVLAAFLDYCLGDPWSWPHPVKGMGWFIDKSSKKILEITEKKALRKLGGILLGLGLILGTGISSWLLIRFAYQMHWLWGMLLETILLASCFAGRSLRNAVLDVLQPLETGNIELARSKLSLYVGRDTEDLNELEILRALLETVAENSIDGVISPLFFALLGGLFPGVGLVPLTLAYKAASTLDSMIGYIREPFTELGWFSAKLEDYLTALPCRLSVLTIAIFSGRPQQVLEICYRDARKDPSPNSGWSECVYAATLEVQMGGKNTYKGIVKEKPFLGDPVKPITSDIVMEALSLTRGCFLLWLFGGILLLTLPDLLTLLLTL